LSSSSSIDLACVIAAPLLRERQSFVSIAAESLHLCATGLGAAEIGREFKRQSKVASENATRAREMGDGRAMDAPIMTLEQLRVFVEVADRLHMTQAAAALNLTQSTASAAIHALETRLDTALFDRIGKRLELTEAGRVLLPEAKAILSKVLGAEQALAELRGLLRGRLRLWASQTIGGYWLPPYLYRFHDAHPGVTIELQIANSLQVSRAVLSGDADLGFVDGEIDEPVLVQVSVAVDQLVVVVAKSHELAMRKTVEFDDLRGASWVLHEKGAGTRQVFEKALRQSGVDPAELNVVMELPSNETVRSLVEAGAGVTVLPRVVVEDKLSAGTLVELPFRRVDRRYVAIRHGDRHRGRAESVLLDMMRPARSRKSDRGPAGP
jgi:DNA-binding transcriptional LysR family regulator